MPIPVERTLRIRPVGGMNTGEPAQDIALEASPDMLNFQVYNGALRKRPGYRKYDTGSTFPAGPITGIFAAQLTSGVRALYATNKVGIFKFNVGTRNWDVQAGPALTGSDHDIFTFEVSQNCLVFSQGVDNIMSLPLAGAVYAVINANAKPSRTLSRWNQRLYAAFTLEAGVNAPFRVRWTIALDHTDWVGIGAGFTDLTDDVYQVKTIKKLVDALCVYTEKGIFLATKTGNSLGPAQYALQIKDIGLYGRNTVQALNVLHFLLGSDNLYAFNGVRLTAIATQCRNTIYAELNAAAIDNDFSSLLFESQEYIVFVATGSNLAADKAWVYNWGRDVTYPWVFLESLFTASTLYYLDASVTIAQLLGTVASQTWVLGQHTLSTNYPLVMLGDSDGHVNALITGVLSDDGRAINCRWTSKDFTAADIDPSYAGYMVTLREVGFSYIDPGTPFTLAFSYSIDRGVSWSDPQNVTVGGTVVGASGDSAAIRQVTGKRVRFKIENNTATEFPWVSEFYPVLELRKQKIA